MRRRLSLFLVGLALLLNGCAIYSRFGLEGEALEKQQAAFAHHLPALSPEMEDQILALDPANVSAEDVSQVLAGTPAPRLIKIHGGARPVHKRMIEFSEFLEGMGYPSASLTNPVDGTYSYSCYESSKKLAGLIAWFYEKEGLRPIMIGHSQGGFQIVKILYKYDGRTARHLSVWNPLTWAPEDRDYIIDPLTGNKQPVVGLQMGYANSLGAGGVTRLLPNQWDTFGRLKRIPDSIEEFTYFHKTPDVYGGELFGFFPALDKSYPIHNAVVRNFQLPSRYNHGKVPNCTHLLKSQAIRDWLNEYRPSTPQMRDEPHFEENYRNIMWAAEVWYHLKKYWVLDLQRYIRARRTLANDSP